MTERRSDKGAATARELHRKLGADLRTTRRQAGWSQRRLGEAAGASHTTVSRIESGRADGTTIDTYARLFAVLGGRLSAKVYPDGDPVRDEAHLRTAGRFLPHVKAPIGVRSEVSLGIPNDLRAWDRVLDVPGDWVPVEIEVQLEDLQALERRVELKARDGGATRVILVVADTAHNRRVLKQHREVLRARFPLDTRAALVYLRKGRLPPVGALVVL
ncbi:MAG: helix-turn-helix domain-containing protein [Chloroflexota bacterium]